VREKTEQESFWQGEFGDAYVDRNDGEAVVASNLALFAKALARAGRIDSLIEFGTNRGLNLIALNRLLPHCRLAGVEINAKAHAAASELGIAEVWQGSVFDYPVAEAFDLALIKGVLIHLAPERLAEAYAKLHAASRRYILVAEYYNPSPVEVSYRGHAGRLFKRDFAGEMLDLYPDLRLVDYGFCYRRDPTFPMDDITWFLLEKQA
jgi:pseudaminic acid biosynthesis-associated methylase